MTIYALALQQRSFCDAVSDSLTIKVIPDLMRSADEQAAVRAFEKSITDFAELPRVIDMATETMGIRNSGNMSGARAFARNTLNIEIKGPSRPQLTLIDIPGLIETATKNVFYSDIDLVTEITNNYISQPRTICLIIISATSDYATQRILTKVREVDPEGSRTLGVITKPDRLPAGSGIERSFIKLARNTDIFSKLGWHVLKNRTFEKNGCSFLERNTYEASYFRKSNFKELPVDCVGVEALRSRLSALLFEHVKRELSKLRQDLQMALEDAENQLGVMGIARTNASECRNYLAHLSLDFYEVCRAGVDGNYRGDFFQVDRAEPFLPTSPQAVRRTRALVQLMNSGYTEDMRTKGHKFHILLSRIVLPMTQTFRRTFGKWMGRTRRPRLQSRCLDNRPSSGPKRSSSGLVKGRSRAPTIRY